MYLTFCRWKDNVNLSFWMHGALHHFRLVYISDGSFFSSSIRPLKQELGLRLFMPSNVKSWYPIYIWQWKLRIELTGKESTLVPWSKPVHARNWQDNIPRINCLFKSRLFNTVGFDTQMYVKAIAFISLVYERLKNGGLVPDCTGPGSVINPAQCLTIGWSCGGKCLRVSLSQQLQAWHIRLLMQWKRGWLPHACLRSKWSTWISIQSFIELCENRLVHVLIKNS